MSEIDSLIQIVKSPELRLYDNIRWGEDPLESLNSDKSHISYLSHLAWMIGNYRRSGGDDKYNHLHDSVCETMNRRIVQSPIMNIPTYPDEPVYVPDMMVAIAALSDYSKLSNGRYSSTVKDWICRAKSEWIDDKTGLLVSFLGNNGIVDTPVKGSYAALNCYYLTKIDDEFAKEQYERLKTYFRQTFPVSGIKEYNGHAFEDNEFRSELLRTAETAGHTVKWRNCRHYLLSDITVVGEAITLAMRTNHSQRHTVIQSR